MKYTTPRYDDRIDRCPTCGGEVLPQREVPCPTCLGAGSVVRSRTTASGARFRRLGSDRSQTSAPDTLGREDAA